MAAFFRDQPDPNIPQPRFASRMTAGVLFALLGWTTACDDKDSIENKNSGIQQPGGDQEGSSEEERSSEADEDSAEDEDSESSESKDSDSESDGDGDSDSKGEKDSSSSKGGDTSSTNDKKDDTGNGGGDNDEVPGDIEYCKPTKGWDSKWSKLEQQVLELTNKHRAEGATCGIWGKFEPAPPLKMDPNLRCAARVHSKDMADRDYFEHVNLEGVSPHQRMKKAGFSGRTTGENIAAGSSDAAGTVKQWINSAGHCKNLMNKGYKFLGVGYAPGGKYRHVWTQNFGG